jgi:hypothetical protein
MLTALVQAGPTGAGLAFSLLGYWLLLAESKKAKERVEMHTSIRIFILLSALTFALGVFANIVTLIFAARNQAVITAFSPDSTTARFVSWGNDQKQTISFRFLVENLDLARYIPRQEKDNYRLLVALRPTEPRSNDSGSYPYIFGPYPFDSFPEQAVPMVSAGKVVAASCTSYVLFRVRASSLPAELKSPFLPSDYGGSDIKVVNSATDGPGCS